jgi:hypothetical protein
MFVHMTAPNPDSAASVPQAEPSREDGRLRQWLKALLLLGVVLVTEMRHVTDPRSQEGTVGDVAEACAKHSLAWELVTRAMQWVRALQARLAAEARTERTGLSPEAERLERAARLLARPAWYKPSKARKRAPDTRIRPRADDCIAGMPVAEVVAHICADLTAAATLLAKSKALRIVGSIAEAARAMLGGSDDAWKPRPMGWATGGAGAASLPAAAMGLRAPDTG